MNINCISIQFYILLGEFGKEYYKINNKIFNI